MVDSSRRSLFLLGLVVAVCVCAGIAGDASAEFRSATLRSSGACPAGWTIDPLRGECFKCPAGYARTVLPLDALACQRSSHRPATRRGASTGTVLKTDCPKGQFWDPNGSCYSCPSGYARTAAPVTSPEACAAAAPPAFSPAQWRNACPAGSFRDLGRGDCWSCPANFVRTAAPVNSGTACTNDLTGILGVDTRAICRDTLRAIETGGQIAGEAEEALTALMSPVMKPINDAMDAVTRQFRTPAEFDRLLERFAAPLRAHPAFLDEFVSLADRVEKGRARLLQLLLDPEVTCDGDVARLTRELGALGLQPRAARASIPTDALPFSILRRPGQASETPHLYTVISLEGNLTSAHVLGASPP